MRSEKPSRAKARLASARAGERFERVEGVVGMSIEAPRMKTRFWSAIMLGEVSR